MSDMGVAEATLASFKFERRRFYPDLDLEVRLEVNPYRQLSFTAQATIKARGEPGARQRWRDEFWAWAEDRNLDAMSPRYGNRRIDHTSMFDCYLKDWQTVADFIVVWVGVEALSDALTEREEIEDRLGKEVRSLNEAVRSLSDKLSKIEQVCQRQDETWARFRWFLLNAPPAQAHRIEPAQSSSNVFP